VLELHKLDHRFTPLRALHQAMWALRKVNILELHANLHAASFGAADEAVAAFVQHMLFFILFHNLLAEAQCTR